MKFLSTVFCALFCFFLLTAADFNVKDFGAKGDGKTDDTAAIRKAVAAAAKASPSMTCNFSVFFPPGSYNVRGTIQLKNISLRGKDAVISQRDKNAVTFYYTDFWAIRVTGLTFSGGKGHISVINDNTDKSLFFVDNCRFFNCSGTAVETRHGAQSTLVTVKNSEFIRCVRAIDSDSDWTVIRDIWLMTAEKMFDSAAIVNRHGVMTVDNMLGVPLCNGNNQRWIDNYGSLTATGCRFGGEAGGFTAIYNFKKYDIRIPHSVIVRDSEFHAHTSVLRNCAVYCVEVPNIIVVENCRSTQSGGIMVNPDLDLRKYFYGPESMFSYRVTSNAGLSKDPLPAQLARPWIYPLPHPEEHLTGKALQQKIAAVNIPKSKGTCEINALTAPGAELVLTGNMDGSTFGNDELLSIVRKADPAILLRRWGGKRHDAPFAVLRHVRVDLDKTPWLLMDFRSDFPAQFAIKMIDEETGMMHAFRGQQRHPGIWEVNVPKLLPGLKGKKRLTFRIYYIGRTYVPRQGKKAHRYIFAEPGSTLEIHELGFNAARRLPVKK